VGRDDTLPVEVELRETRRDRVRKERCRSKG
jgi:hypothetical protein